MLETICAKRAKQSFELTLNGIKGEQKAADKLNHLLTGMIPLHDEKLSFILMLLPTFNLPEGKSLKTSYCDSLRNVFLPAVRDTINEGIASGEMICGDPYIFADAVITLVNRLWVSVCDMIIENERENRNNELPEILHIAEQYRTVLERTLSIAYGSLVLLNIPSLNGLIEQIHLHWH